MAEDGSVTQQLPLDPAIPAPVIGPPPQPPRPPQPYEPYRTSHVLHLLLTVFTCGLWAPMWILLGVTAGNADKRERQRAAEEHAAFRAAYEQFRAAYAAWEHQHYLTFGYVPQIPR